MTNAANTSLALVLASRVKCDGQTFYLASIKGDELRALCANCKQFHVLRQEIAA